MAENPDILVVGSGAGGAPVATEMALAGAKVTLLEAGGKAPIATLDDSILEAAMRVVRDGSMSFSVMGGLHPHTVLHGRCEGGSTALNAGSTFRLPDFLNRDWQKIGIDDLEPYFDRVNTFLKVEPTDEELISRGGQLMLRAINELNWKGGPVPRNAPGCTGRKVCTFGCPEEAKRSTQISYLPEARKAGAKVKLNSPVIRLLLENKRATGVITIEDGREKKINADKVVISCGSLETPAFLERNGIGIPHIGEHLMVHPEGLLAVHFEENIEPSGRWVPQGVFSDEFLEDEGIMFLQASMPSYAALPGLILSGSIKASLDYKHTALWGIVVRDEGNNGHVRSGRYTKRHMRYSPGLIARQRLRRGYLHLAEAAFRVGATGVTPFYMGSGHCRNLKELESRLPNPLPAGGMLPFSLHSMGTCGIGRICEPDGRVRGYENLYVADASLLPTSIGVNPQFTIMALSTMIATKMMGL